MRDGGLGTALVGDVGGDGLGGESGAAVGAWNVVDGRCGTPVKSLRVRRWRREGNSGITLSVLISSSVGVTPRYQAEGEEGDSSRNS